MLSKILPDKFLTKMSAADRVKLGKAGLTAADAQEIVEYRYEREFQKDIVNLLNQRDIFYIQPPFGRHTRLKKGLPDFNFALKGRACALEAKIMDKEPTTQQKIVHEAMIRNGWRLAVVRNISEVQEFLNTQ